MSDNYVMRRMSRDELDTVVGWAADEGWNPGLHDAGAFYAADPGGFYLGLLDGEPVASLSVVRYSSEYAFMGFYIVRPSARGKGYGLRLWQYALEQSEAAKLGLDGVVDQQDNYRRSGFVPAHRNVRYETTKAEKPWAEPQAFGRAGSVRAFVPDDIDRVIDYDQSVFKAPRGVFLSRWLKLPGSHALIATERDAVIGYGMIRPARDGYRIGPLFAETEEAASVILTALIGKVPIGSRVSIDVPMANEASIKVVTERGMTPAFETVRMYTESTARMAVEKVFGITSLELG